MATVPIKTHTHTRMHKKMHTCIKTHTHAHKPCAAFSTLSLKTRSVVAKHASHLKDRMWVARAGRACPTRRMPACLCCCCCCCCCCCSSSSWSSGASMRQARMKPSGPAHVSLRQQPEMTMQRSGVEQPLRPSWRSCINAPAVQ